MAPQSSLSSASCEVAAHKTIYDKGLQIRYEVAGSTYVNPHSPMAPRPSLALYRNS